MSNGLETEQDDVVGLVSGIIADFRVLTNQQLALIRHEMKREIAHLREAGSLVAVGFAIVAIGSLLLCAMLVRLLAQMVPDFPLWACYGIVGTPIVVLGGILCLIGIQRFKQPEPGAVVERRERRRKSDG
jgi:flagellar biosynthesis protein FliR